MKGIIIAGAVVIVGMAIFYGLLYINYQHDLSNIVYEGYYNPPSFAEFIDSKMNYSDSDIVSILGIIPWTLGYQSDQAQWIFALGFVAIIMIFFGAICGLVYGKVKKADRSNNNP